MLVSVLSLPLTSRQDMFKCSQTVSFLIYQTPFGINLVYMIIVHLRLSALTSVTVFEVIFCASSETSCSWHNVNYS